MNESVTPAPVVKTPSPEPKQKKSIAIESPEFDQWIEHFYKECGREVTLAYTTLNQMKNWAVLIVAAVVSAVLALQKLVATDAAPNDLPIFIGAIISYVFTLRFFVRAILCYINLVRWNNLQNSIVAFKVAQPSPVGESQPKTQQELKNEVLLKIDELYFRWRAPERLTRGAQLLANLKLGFGLLLALPLFFGVVVGIHVIRSSQLALGITTFAIGYTIVELVDFLSSSWFDTPQAYARRKKSREKEIFPTPSVGMRYLILSGLNVLLSITVGLWPQLCEFFGRVMGCN
jgi:hypothetical protein